MNSTDPGTIYAGHVIYGNPRANQLPGIKDDFQTVFYSAEDVQLDELKFIEPRLHGITRQDSRIGRVFFEVPSSGRFVVGQIVQTDERDRRDRPQFLAHALVIRKEDLRRIGNNPFVIFSSFRFLKDFGEVISFAENERINVPTDIQESNRWIPRAMIQPKWTCDPTPDFWEDFPMESAFRLLFISERAERTDRDRRETLALEGCESEVRATLASLFSIMSPDIRPLCSFDTSFCNQSETRLQSCPYWAVGIDPNWKETLRGTFTRYSTEKKTFQVSSDLKPTTTFERWATNALSGTNGWQQIGALQRIRVASNWWDGDADEVHLPNVSAELIQLNASMWKHHIQSRLNHFLGANASDIQAPFLWVELISAAYGLSKPLLVWRHLDASRISKVLTEFYIGRRDMPSEEELKCVLQWYKHNSKPSPSLDLYSLACVFCRWTKDWDKLVQFLWQLPDAPRGATVKWVLSTFDGDDEANTEEVFGQKIADAFSSRFKSNTDARSFTAVLVKAAARSVNTSPHNLAAEPNLVTRMTQAISIVGRWFGLDK